MLLWIALIVLSVVSAFAARKSLWGTPPDSPSIRAASQEPENGLIPQEETTQKEHAAAAEAKDILKAPVHDDTNGSGSPAQASSISQTPITRSAAQLQMYVPSTYDQPVSV